MLERRRVVAAGLTVGFLAILAGSRAFPSSPHASTRLGEPPASSGTAVLPASPVTAGPPASSRIPEPAPARATSSAASSGTAEPPASRPASAATATGTLEVETFPLPGGTGGIGFDDMLFARGIKRVVVPAGRSGSLVLIDPETHGPIAIGGFSEAERHEPGHGEGTTSADEGRGFLFAIDRTAKVLDVVDPGSRAIVSRAPLASSPDYIRFVEPTGELWVTEPDEDRIEVFRLGDSRPPRPVHALFIAILGGPESLVIDAKRGRAYTNLWKSTTLSIDLRSHAIHDRWSNGCTGSRGIALDAAHGRLFVGCAEGKAAVLDLDHGGAVLDHAGEVSGVDIIAYDPDLAHLYLPGASSATLAVLGVSAAGKLSVLGTVKTAKGSHCAVVDDHHQVWICDPEKGRLLLFRDTLPGSGR